VGDKLVGFDRQFLIKSQNLRKKIFLIKILIQLDPGFGSPGFGKIRYWQPICKALAASMANIMLMCSDYGKPDFSKTPNLANDFYARTA
jgi:hypothetical protein